MFKQDNHAMPNAMFSNMEGWWVIFLELSSEGPVYCPMPHERWRYKLAYQKLHCLTSSWPSPAERCQPKLTSSPCLRFLHHDSWQLLTSGHCLFMAYISPFVIVMGFIQFFWASVLDVDLRTEAPGPCAGEAKQLRQSAKKHLLRFSSCSHWLQSVIQCHICAMSFCLHATYRLCASSKSPFALLRNIAGAFFTAASLTDLWLLCRQGRVSWKPWGRLRT